MASERQERKLPVWLTYDQFCAEGGFSKGHLKGLIKRGVYVPRYFGPRSPRLASALLTDAQTPKKAS